MSSTTPSTPLSGHANPVGRRAVLRTAGTAAWAAPVIVVASAAPAFAASGPAAVTTMMSASRTDRVLTVTLTLTNANTGDAGLTTVVVTATNRIAGSVLSGDPVFVANDGWTFVSRSGNSGSRTYDFRKDNLLGAATATSSVASTFAFTIPVTENIADLHGGDLSAVPSVSSGGAATGTVAVWT